MPSYNPKVIEPRWQQFWEENKTFRTPEDSAKPKLYILDMFPYPSGSGLHVGHPEGYTATDILARFRRMQGFDVLHPMGWDAFGLPAEQYAIQTGTHPRVTTQNNINTFRRQIKMLGFSYDWDREVDTTDPAYFRWTQWIFLQLFDTWYDREARKGRPIADLPIPAHIQAEGADAVRRFQDGKRLAYQAEVPVNWCPALGTVLANEEVIDGKSERGNHPVVRMPLRQWLLRITEYADRLLEELDQVNWSESIKQVQRNWIGRSVGAEVDFMLKLTGIDPPADRIRVFTTRPDTLFGATYMVLAPEHPLVPFITTSEQGEAVQKYRDAAARKSERERTELAKKKTGVFTGAFAFNPLDHSQVPIWIADYVLWGYGTGAIMAVPAHDDRDFAFAKQFRLPIRPVVLPPASWLEATQVYKVLRSAAMDEIPALRPSAREQPDNIDTLDLHDSRILMAAQAIWEKLGRDPRRVTEQLYRHQPGLFAECFTEEGTAINSGPFDGLSTAEFKTKITDWLEERKLGQRKVNFKLRDWLFSRQRYWGEPFPILHELDAAGNPTGVVRPLSPSDLPLKLPELTDYQPSGKPEPPLDKAKDWLEVTLDGKRYRRETNTMPQWAGSCWYYLRYIDPKNDQQFCDPAKLQRWLPVDLYVGGAEHAVLHLLYSRFWHKVLFDRGLVPTAEPFQRLVNQGMILGEVEYTGFKMSGQWISAEFVDFDGDVAKDQRGDTQFDVVKLSPEQVVKKGAGFVLAENEKIRIDHRAYKMSKARGNVINPDKVVEMYGADSLRLYEMFMGPLEAVKPWSMSSIEGVYRFLSRAWRLIVEERSETVRLAETMRDVPMERETKRLLHQTIQRVTNDLESMSFNTAIAAMMEFTNHLTQLSARPRAALEPFVLLLSPFAPHLAEELWHALGHPSTLAYEPWPKYEEALLQADEIEVPVQINGKVKVKLTVPAETDQATLEKTVLADARVQALIAGKPIRKLIVVPKKLVNIVI